VSSTSAKGLRIACSAFADAKGRNGEVAEAQIEGFAEGHALVASFAALWFFSFAENAPEAEPTISGVTP
jgi:hypothetical protein